METDHWDLLAAGRHSLADNGTTTLHPGDHNHVNKCLTSNLTNREPNKLTIYNMYTMGNMDNQGKLKIQRTDGKGKQD